MSEMVEMKSGAIADQSTIFTDFHISEYIYIRLVCISFLFVPFQESNDLRSYNDLNRSKLLLSTAILAMRTQECPIPIFVEVVNRLLLLPFQGVPSSSPLLGSYFPHYGERGCSTTFSSSFYRRCPDFCADIPSLVSWFSCQTNTPKDKVIVSRSYDWIVTYSSHASWRFNQMDKEIQQRQLPVLFMLQGFSSVALWGPSICPLAALSLSIAMPPIEFVGSLGSELIVGENASFRPDGVAPLLGEKQLYRHQETPALLHVSVDVEVLVRGCFRRDAPNAVLDGTEVLHAAPLGGGANAAFECGRNVICRFWNHDVFEYDGASDWSKLNLPLVPILESFREHGGRRGRDQVHFHEANPSGRRDACGRRGAFGFHTARLSNRGGELQPIR